MRFVRHRPQVGSASAARSRMSSSPIWIAARRRPRWRPKPENPTPLIARQHAGEGRRRRRPTRSAEGPGQARTPPPADQAVSRTCRAKVPGRCHAAPTTRAGRRQPRQLAPQSAAVPPESELSTTRRAAAGRAGRRHPVRFEGRRLRPVAAALQGAGQAQLVRAAGRDVLHGHVVDSVLRSSATARSPTSEIVAAVARSSPSTRRRSMR